MSVIGVKGPKGGYHKPAGGKKGAMGTHTKGPSHSGTGVVGGRVTTSGHTGSVGAPSASTYARPKPGSTMGPAGGYVPPQSQGKQVTSSNFMGRRMGPGGGELTPVGGKKAGMGSGGSGGSNAGPFGNTGAPGGVAGYVQRHRGFGGMTASPLRKVTTGPKGSDGSTGMKSYQHVPFKKGFKNMGPARHENLHHSVRPPDTLPGGVTGSKGDKATGPNTGRRANLPQNSEKKGLPNKLST